MHEPNPTWQSNRLLSALSEETRKGLLERAVAQSMQLKTVLYAEYEPPPLAYFPLTGVASVVALTAEGRSSEVGFIGCDGVTGAYHLLGPAEVPTRCFVQIEGSFREFRDQLALGEADDSEQSERDGSAVAELFEAAARAMKGERQQKKGFGRDRDQPDPPGKNPELPVLDTTDHRKQHLQPDHDKDGRRSFPARLDFLFAQCVARHRSEPAAALEEREQHRQRNDLGAKTERDKGPPAGDVPDLEAEVLPEEAGQPA